MEEWIREQLWEMQDLAYKEFQSKLMPTVSSDTIIGIRVPQLRAFAKRMKEEPDIGRFLRALPHSYYEEDNLHAFLIEQIRDYEACVAEVNRFLPHVDNWATCDMMRPKCFVRHGEELLREIEIWLNAEHTYTIRFGIGMLMNFYLEDRFEKGFLERVSKIESEEYYVNMMIAWYFATALAKQYEAAVIYLEERRLPVWVHNKTIQKAVESRRISKEKKEYLRKLQQKRDSKGSIN